MKSWIDYWNSDHPIYVNERHRMLHAEAVGRDIVRHVPSPSAVVLDHGCGEARYAEAVAAHCARLVLCEAAPAVRARLAARVAGLANIAVIGPDEVAGVGDGSIDLVVANSLVQYLTRPEFAGLLDLWRGKLAAAGRLVVADVIPPDLGPAADALALLRFAWSGGFAGAAALGLLKTALSDYRHLRTALGFATYREDEMLALLAAHGYRGERVRPNFGHNQSRMAFRATLA